MSTSSGTVVTPSARRHRSTVAGSGPASTTTAVPSSPVASTSASPCPTSQTTMRQSDGGQPVNGRTSGVGRSTTSNSSRAQATHSHGRFSTRSPDAHISTVIVSSASSSAPVQLPGHAISAPGRAAPARAIPAMHSVGQLASQASPFANGIAQGAAASEANPSTVAGATANSASRLHGTATRLT
ncbi:hypothetical protein GCM10027091_23480 [Streptomyces daliensis]